MIKIKDRKEYLEVQKFESGHDYIKNNLEAAVWLLDDSKLILQALYNYDRVINLVQEEVDG